MKMPQRQRKIRNLGVLDRHVAKAQGLTEDVKCELAGDVMAIPVLGRILAAIPE